jgi:hypothetical protein
LYDEGLQPSQRRRYTQGRLVEESFGPPGEKTPYSRSSCCKSRGLDRSKEGLCSPDQCGKLPLASNAPATHWPSHLRWICFMTRFQREGFTQTIRFKNHATTGSKYSKSESVTSRRFGTTWSTNWSLALNNMYEIGPRDMKHFKEFKLLTSPCIDERKTTSPVSAFSDRTRAS